MADNDSPDDLPAPRRDVPLQLTDSEGRQVWVVHSSVGGDGSNDESDFSVFLRELPDVLRDHWFVVTAIVGIVCGLGYTYLRYAEPVYGVNAEILVERRESALDEFERMKSGNVFLATQAEIIHSPTIAEPALASLSEPLVEPFDEAGEPVDSLSKTLSLLTVTPIRGTDVVSINLRSPEAELGSEFVQALIREYQSFLYNIEFSAHNDALELLTSRETELRSKLAALKEEYRQSLRENGAIGQTSLRALQESILEHHARSAADAASRRATQQSKLSALEHAIDTGSLAVPPGTVDETLLEQLQEARARRSGLKAIVGARHPDMRAVDGEIAGLERQVVAAVQAEIGRLRHAIQTDRAQEWRIAQELDAEIERNSATEAERYGQEELQAEIAQLTEIHDQTFRMLAAKRLEVGALEQAGVIVRVLARPPAIPEKIWPRAPLVLLPCLLIGLVGGLAFALLIDRRRDVPAATESYLEPAPPLPEAPTAAPEVLPASVEAGSDR